MNNKMKVSKSTLIMSIVSISLTFLYIFFETLSMYIKDFEIIEPVRSFFHFSEYNSFVLVASIVVIISLILNIFFPKKGLAIVNMIFSFASFNVLSVITSIMLIMEINKSNEEIERIKREKEDVESKDDILVEGNQINGEVIQKNQVKKVITHVKYDDSMQTRLMVGIGIASIYLILIGAAFYGVIYGLSICFGPNASESQTWGGLYLMFLLILLIFPLAIEIINITITAFALHDKKVRTAKMMRVFGYISLTFINANVAREAIRNAYLEIE